MEICYDMSYAAWAAARPDGMTGVPRVVDNVLRGLARARGSELRLCAPTSPLDGWEYFQSNFVATGARFLHSRLPSISGRIWQQVNYHAAGRRQRRWPSDRLTRYLLYNVGTPFLGRIDPEGLAGVEAYHSPHGSIPEEVRQHRHIRVFLTIYDLIPFRRPDFFLPRVGEAQQRIMQTMKLEEDRFLCISESTKKDLCEFYPVDPARVFVTPLAAAAGTFYPCRDDGRRLATLRKYGVPEEDRYVLSVCTLEPRKNLRTVLGAFRTLLEQEKVSDLRLVLVGGKGWLDGPLLADLERMGVWRDRVHLLGYVPDADLAAIYSGALCFTYMSFYEGFGLPPLEAMQCGVPVITSNASSLPEVIGDAGISLDPTDESGLAEAISRLHQSAGLREQMAAQSLARAKLFSWERCLQATIDAYATA